MKPRRALTPEERDGLMLMTPEDVHEVTGWHVQRVREGIRNRLIPAIRRGSRGRPLCSWPHIWSALNTVEVQELMAGPESTDAPHNVDDTPSAIDDRTMPLEEQTTGVVESTDSLDMPDTPGVRRILRLIRPGEGT